MSNDDVEWVVADEVQPEIRPGEGDGIRIRRLWSQGDMSAAVVEIPPGACWAGEPDRHDAGPEEIFVVSGTFNDGVRDYPPRTFVHNPTGSHHVPQSKDGCVLFVFTPQG